MTTYQELPRLPVERFGNSVASDESAHAVADERNRVRVRMFPSNKLVELFLQPIAADINTAVRLKALVGRGYIHPVGSLMLSRPELLRDIRGDRRPVARTAPQTVGKDNQMCPARLTLPGPRALGLAISYHWPGMHARSIDRLID